MAFSTTRLLSQIKQKGSIPDGRFDTDQEILDLAYDALLTEVVPFIISLRENYYVRSRDVAMVASQAEYPFPDRAFGQTLRRVAYIKGDRVIHLDRMDLDEITTTTEGEPSHVYVEGNSLFLYRTPDRAYGTLREWFFMRPSKLVPVDECARITNIVGNVLSISPPASFTISETYDLVQGRDGYKIIDFDLTPVAVGISSIEFSSIPSTLQIGDYVCLAGESCFPFCPTEAHNYLVEQSVVECLQSIGDQSNLQIAAARVERVKANLKNIFSLRIESQPKPFVRPLR